MIEFISVYKDSKGVEIGICIDRSNGKSAPAERINGTTKTVGKWK